MLDTHKFSHSDNIVLQKIKRADLFREAAYIDGQWISDDDAEAVIQVTNPADQSFLGTVPLLYAESADQAIKAAQDAQVKWAKWLPQDRANVLKKWSALMLGHKEDLAALMVLEQGKPIAEARGEINYAASFLEWFGEEAKRGYGDVIPAHLPDRKMIVSRKPIGVCAAITPWNFPSAMIARKAGAALATGCAMVVRPADETPFSALALAVLAEEAGLPAGVFNVVTGDAPDIAAAFMASDIVRHVSFTGSTEIGRILLGQSGATVKKMALELGGHAPFIVFPDADMDRAVDGAIGAKFATTGQDCLAVNRFYVHEDIYDEFAKRFTQATQALKLADGFDEEADLGPLMNSAAMEKCVAHVEDARAKGASLLCGGEKDAQGALFYKATVLGDVTADMIIFHEETFGPVAALSRFRDEDEVVAAANDTIYGLAAYLYTGDTGRSLRVSEALDYGMVGVNTPSFTGAPIPFGGVKQSGLGREGARQGLEDYTELQYTCLSTL